MLKGITMKVRLRLVCVTLVPGGSTRYGSVESCHWAFFYECPSCGVVTSRMDPTRFPHKKLEPDYCEDCRE